MEHRVQKLETVLGNEPTHLVNDDIFLLFLNKFQGFEVNHWLITWLTGWCILLHYLYLTISLSFSLFFQWVFWNWVTTVQTGTLQFNMLSHFACSFALTLFYLVVKWDSSGIIYYLYTIILFVFSHKKTLSMFTLQSAITADLEIKEKNLLVSSWYSVI